MRVQTDNDGLLWPKGTTHDNVHRAYAELGAAIFGGRADDITHGWDGTFPENDAPLFVLRHAPPPIE